MDRHCLGYPARISRSDGGWEENQQGEPGFHSDEGRARSPYGNAIENACWDLEARQAGLPLWNYLGGTQREIPCGVSIGIQDTPEILLEKIEKEVVAGYQRIKIKIKPGWDVKIVERVRKHFPEIRLMGDANSAYTLADVSLFRELDRFNLMMIEQPLAHDDIFDHAILQQQIETAVCLDESIHSAEDAKHAIDLKSCRIINVKLGRVGGHAEAKRLERITRESNIPVWCGGMLEAGIGRAHNIASFCQCPLLGRRHHRTARYCVHTWNYHCTRSAGDWVRRQATQVGRPDSAQRNNQSSNRFSCDITRNLFPIL